MGKRILIEFVGGDFDGRTLDSESPNEHERWLVDSCMSMTHNGTVGCAFHGFSMSTIEARMRGEEVEAGSPKGTHKYTVLDRLDDGDEVLIRMGYSVKPLAK